jgi:hypothetical protein
LATLDIDLRGSGLTAAGMTFASAALALRGTLLASGMTASLVPTDAPRIDANSWIALDDGVALRTRDSK